MSINTVKFLALDSSGTLCSVSVEGFQNSAFVSSEIGQKHTSVIFSLIRRAFEIAGGSLNEVDAIVFGAGPGAFTGLRVSCGIAQGFGWALDKKLIPVCNLEALAYSQLQNIPNDCTILVATDARMHECYTAVYKRKGEILVEIEAPFLTVPASLEETAHKHNCALAVGNAFKVYENEIPKNLKVLSTEDLNAQMLITPALIAYCEEKLVTAENAAPLYVRNHVAQTIEERKEAKLAKSSC